MKMQFTKWGEKGEALLAALKKKWLLIAALALGLVLLAAPGDGAEAETVRGSQVPEFSLEEEEAKLARALEKMDGVGKVSVVLTLKSSVEQKIARDESTQYRTLTEGYELESDSSAVRVQSGSGVQEPVTLKYLYPEYKGALIIAEHAGAAIKLEITNAVSALTGLTSDKITVVAGR